MNKKRSRFIVPNSYQLQIDLDSEEQLVKFLDQFRIFIASKVWSVRSFSFTPSSKDHHWHATIELKKQMRSIERIALQAVLNSDLRRELFNLCRAKLKQPFPVLFFEELLKKPVPRLLPSPLAAMRKQRGKS